MAGASEQIVTDAQGNEHHFPSEATPEMIAKALGVKPPGVMTPPAPPTGYEAIAQQEGRLAQESLYRTLGPEAQGRSVLGRIGSSLAAGYHQATRVGAKVLGGLSDPTTATVAASGLIDPAIPAAYFGTQAVSGLTGVGTEQPSSVKTAIQQPTPENVETPFLQGAQAAASGASAGSVGPGQVVEAVKGAPGALKVGVTEAMDIGKRFIEKEKAKVDTLNQAATDAHAQQMADYRMKLQKARAANSSDVQKYEGQKAQVEQENAVAQKDYQQTSDTINKMNELRTSHQAERTQLANDITNNATQLAMEAKDLEKAVRERGNEKFEEVARATEGEQADMTALAAAVEHARSNIIKGSPENIKVFNSLLRDASPQSASIGGENIPPGSPLYESLLGKGIIEGPTPLGWRDLQGYYTELGQAMYGREIPGDVYKALQYVREHGVGEQMGQMAARKGVTAQWADARGYWKNFQDTFHDMKAVSQGGSPVARIVRALDPDVVVSQLSRDGGVRAVEMLRKYDPEMAQTATQTRAMYRHVEGTKALYGKVQAPPEPPALKTTPAPPKIKSMPTPPGTPEIKPFDPVAAKEAAIQRIADKARGMGGWGFYIDLGALTGASGALLKGHPYVAANMMAFPVMRRVLGAALERPGVVHALSTEPKAPLRPITPPPGTPQVTPQ